MSFLSPRRPVSLHGAPLAPSLRARKAPGCPPPFCLSKERPTYTRKIVHARSKKHVERLKNAPPLRIFFNPARFGYTANEPPPPARAIVARPTKNPTKRSYHDTAVCLLPFLARPEQDQSTPDTAVSEDLSTLGVDARIVGYRGGGGGGTPRPKPSVISTSKTKQKKGQSTKRGREGGVRTADGSGQRESKISGASLLVCALCQLLGLLSDGSDVAHLHQNERSGGAGGVVACVRKEWVNTQRSPRWCTHGRTNVNCHRQFPSLKKSQTASCPRPTRSSTSSSPSLGLFSFSFYSISLPHLISSPRCTR